MSDTVKIVLVLLAIPLTWFLLAKFLRWVLEAADETETQAEREESEYHTQMQILTNRIAGLYEDARHQMGGLTPEQSFSLANLERERNQLMANGVQHSPAPSGRTLRAK